MISDNVQVRLVGGKIVRSQQHQHEASVTSTSSPKYDCHSYDDGDLDNDTEQKQDKILTTMSRVVRKQSSEQTMVATTEERGKLVIINMVILTILTIKLVTMLTNHDKRFVGEHGRRRRPRPPLRLAWRSGGRRTT